jgi:hypothetical protein
VEEEAWAASGEEPRYESEDLSDGVTRTSVVNRPEVDQSFRFGDWFASQSEVEDPQRAPIAQDATLFLAMNDYTDGFGDNDGSLTITFRGYTQELPEGWWNLVTRKWEPIRV